MEHLFGPVLSRRLGLSMGVDLLPYKTCNLNCVYCELGRTTSLAKSRGKFVDSEKILREIRSRRQESFDYLTFAGSGEPTLCSNLGEIIGGAKELVDVPVAVITNGTLLASKEVREEVAAADVIMPSLDAATQEIFHAVNRPGRDLHIEKIIDGLRALRSEYRGEIWLEVMLVKDLNEHEAELIAKAVKSINPDRTQLNTVVRTPAEPVLPLSQKEMQRMLEIFESAEIIPDWDWKVPARGKAQLLELLSRRPCTLEEISTLLDMTMSDVIKYIKIMERGGRITRRLHNGRQHFQASER